MYTFGINNIMLEEVLEEQGKDWRLDSFTHLWQSQVNRNRFGNVKDFSILSNNEHETVKSLKTRTKKS